MLSSLGNPRSFSLTLNVNEVVDLEMEEEEEEDRKHVVVFLTMKSVATTGTMDSSCIGRKRSDVSMPSSPFLTGYFIQQLDYPATHGPSHTIYPS